MNRRGTLRQLVRFGSFSLGCAGLDAALLVALHSVTQGHLLVSVAGARIISGSVNFSLNRRAVFADTGDVTRAARRYLVLAGTVLGANYALMALLATGLGWPLLAAKAVVEVTLFLVSYAAQRRLVFRRASMPSTASSRQAMALATTSMASTS